MRNIIMPDERLQYFEFFCYVIFSTKDCVCSLVRKQEKNLDKRKKNENEKKVHKSYQSVHKSLFCVFHSKINWCKALVVHDAWAHLLE